MANINDKFGKASLSTDYAQATTVKTTRTPGESVLAAFDLSKFATDTPVYFLTYRKVIDPTTGEVSITNQTSWKALVNPDNNTLTNLTLAPGYIDTGNQVGDYIEPSPTSYWGNSLIEGLQTSLNDDGTLKKGVVTPNALADSGWTSVSGTGYWYRRIAGVVHLSGYKVDVSGSGVVTLFTLPVGFRPIAAGVSIPIRVDQGTSKYVWADVNGSGNVRISKSDATTLGVQIGGSFAT